jgi:hypothetical protein
MLECSKFFFKPLASVGKEVFDRSRKFEIRFEDFLIEKLSNGDVVVFFQNVRLVGGSFQRTNSQGGEWSITRAVYIQLFNFLDCNYNG